MKGISIELVDVMGSDSSTSNSARVSFNKWKEDFDESDAKLIKYLAEHKHLTPFRHNQIQIRCKAPIFLARQLGKHQAGLSWNEVSRRYVKTEPEFFIPESWRAAPEGNIKQGSGSGFSKKLEDLIEGGLTDIEVYYESFMDLYLEFYTQLIDEGVAPEMARMVLPQSMLTEWVWSGNLLAFAHIYNERSAEGSQEEAKAFAKELNKIIEPLFPVSWKALTKQN